ncbi:hypothetical protein CLIB1444_03S07382 [[Candida] jaroonii]|uniref:Uncharacterized protein n=1 Tax=[Candida] jaroonii TaxID=467808 RepID=A0ACA9Y5S9_9ASCO|nr:hypothetical protein CLIB1444_03S07382 [[Candida] jaroonii]
MITHLPKEIIGQIFDSIPVDVLYDKFVRPYGGNFNGYQMMALERISQLIIIRNGAKDINYDPMAHFYPSSSYLEIIDYYQGYYLLKKILSIKRPSGKESNKTPFLKEVGFYFHYKPQYTVDQISYQIKYLLLMFEMLALDTSYLKSVRISVQMIFDCPWAPSVGKDMAKIPDRINGFNHKINKLLVQNRHNIGTSKPFLNLSKFDIIDELRLYNDRINDRELRKLNYLSNLPFLRILDLTGNFIDKIDHVPTLPRLKKLILNANNLRKLEPGFSLTKTTHIKNFKDLEVLEVSVNGLESLKNVKFPSNLKILRLAYNRISTIDFVLPPKLEELNLSSNLLSNVNGVMLPPTMKKLLLSNNQFEEFPDDFFSGTQLQSLLVDSNSISDLDDLGNLPDSLTHLVLDGNEINYANISNILKPNLKILSMNATGMMTLENIQFPNSLEKLSLVHNFISEISNVNFGDNLKVLDLSSNILTSLKCIDENIIIPDNLHTLNLEANAFKSLYDFDLPENLKELNAGGLDVDFLEGEDIENFPNSLEVIKLYYMMVRRGEEMELDLRGFKHLKSFSFTSPDVKHLELKINDGVVVEVECDCDSDLKEEPLL